MSLIGINITSIGTRPSRIEAFTTSSEDLVFGLLLGQVNADGVPINFTESFTNVKFGIKRYLSQTTPNYQTDSLTGLVTQNTVTVDGIDYLHIGVVVPKATKPAFALGFAEFVGIYADGTTRSLNLGQYINVNGVIT